MIKLGGVKLNWQMLSNSVFMACKLFLQQLAEHFHDLLSLQMKVLSHNKFCTVLIKNV